MRNTDASFSIWTALALTATLAVAIFGFMLMSEPGHMVAGCFGAVPAGNCPSLGAIEHFKVHIATFQSVSIGITKAAAVALFVLLVVAALLAAFARAGGTSLRDPVTVPFEREVPRPRTASLIRWLSLHEWRDPSLLRAVNA